MLKSDFPCLKVILIDFSCCRLRRWSHTHPFSVSQTGGLHQAKVRWKLLHSNRSLAIHVGYEQAVYIVYAVSYIISYAHVCMQIYVFIVYYIHKCHTMFPFHVTPSSGQNYVKLNAINKPYRLWGFQYSFFFKVVGVHGAYIDIWWFEYHTHIYIYIGTYILCYLYILIE